MKMWLVLYMLLSAATVEGEISSTGRDVNYYSKGIADVENNISELKCRLL